MKKIMSIILTMITMPLLQGYASTFLSIENGGHKYFVTVWKHTEGKDDTVERTFFYKEEVAEIDGMLESKKGIRAVFNDGVFTSMNYREGETKRWATLSVAEKDLIFYLQGKFNLTEK